MAPAADNALIVQSDSSVLLEVHAPRAGAAREALAPFAELVKSPEHVHTYRLTPLSIWNARSSGLSGAAMVAALREHAKYPVPDNVVTEVGELAARYGRVVLTKDGDALVCTCLDQPTAELLARRRLGLTATLVREDGREGDVFALIGPKRYDVPWRDLEQRAWIATAVRTEVRVPMSDERRMEYALAERRAQFRVAAENPEKTTQVRSILARCPEGRVLIIGEYITQLEWLARELSAPLVTGKTPQIEREQLYDPFLPLLDPEGPAVVTNAALLETQDLAQLLELSRDPRVGRYLLARLSDTVALVDPGAEALLIKALRAAGHTPRTVKGVEP